MHLVKGVAYVADYKLMLTFEDDSTRLVDLESHLDGEVFEPLKTIDIFKAFRVEPDLDTVVWPNGADFSPDFLYEIGEPVAQST